MFDAHRPQWVKHRWPLLLSCSDQADPRSPYLNGEECSVLDDEGLDLEALTEVSSLVHSPQGTGLVCVDTHAQLLSGETQNKYKFNIFIVLKASNPSQVALQQLNSLRQSVKLTIIVSDNALSPKRRQAIIWTNVGLLSMEPWGTNFNEIFIKIWQFSSKKVHLKKYLENGVHFVSPSMC